MKISRYVVAVGLVMVVVLWGASAMAADVMVNTLVDEVNATDGVCSLHEAVSAVNNKAASGNVQGECAAGVPGAVDVIHLMAGTYDLSNNGILIITKNVKIIGPDSGDAILDAKGNESLFAIDVPFEQDVNTTIEKVSLTNGFAGAYSNNGGAVALANGALTLLNCRIYGNKADANLGGGGAVAVSGHSQLTIKGSFISNNSAYNGGGILVGNGTLQTSISISDSTISGNKAATIGGGVFVAPNAAASISRSAIVENNAGASILAGGGIFNAGTLTIQNSTIARNTAKATPDSTGGGIYNSGVMTIYYSTITENVGGVTGGIVGTKGHVQVKDSILMGNNPIGGHSSDGTGLEDCAGVVSAVTGKVTSIVSQGYNIVGYDCGLSFQDTDLRSYTDGDTFLANFINGSYPAGSFYTLKDNSKAIGKALWVKLGDKDQLGNPRPADSADIGAIQAWCGDVVVQTVRGEQCDMGSDNGKGKGCDATCKIEAGAVVQPPAPADGGAAPGGQIPPVDGAVAPDGPQSPVDGGVAVAGGALAGSDGSADGAPAGGASASDAPADNAPANASPSGGGGGGCSLIRE